MKIPKGLPPLPGPLLEDVDYEVWGQNAKTDCYTPEAMRSYGRACYAAGAAAERAKLAQQSTPSAGIIYPNGLPKDAPC